jgi:hypothetical protein
MQATLSATTERSHIHANPVSHTSPSREASETLRNAYNAAFDELELGWHWCESQFRELQRHSDERSRMQAYLSAQQPHLLKVYDVDFFVDAVREAKTKYYRSLEVVGGIANKQAQR